MREVYRLSAIAVFLSCVAVFVAVPAAAMALGMADLIYTESRVDPWDTVLNLAALLPMLLPLVWVLRLAPDPLPSRSGGALPVSVVLAVVGLWCAVYLLSGGMSYRVTDLYEGQGARGAGLRVAQTLTNVVMILAVAANLERGRPPTRALAGALCLVLPLACFILAGGRGLVMQLVLTLGVARHLVHSSHHVALASVPMRSGARWLGGAPGQWSVRFLTLPRLLIGVGGLSGLALWGVLRDPDSGPVVFAALHRAAEPYWHDAQAAYQRNGFDITVLWDALHRMLSIPGRWIGLQYESSVDGAERILEDRLGIPFVEGISLPITFFGEGMLLAGHYGAALFCLAAMGMVLLGIGLTRFMLVRSWPVYSAFLAMQVVKSLMLYPKSLSGTVLVMVYETCRDGLLLALLTNWVTSRAHAE
jgi:hypothetical protein